jgi:hypothetical protein
VINCGQLGNFSTYPEPFTASSQFSRCFSNAFTQIFYANNPGSAGILPPKNQNDRRSVCTEENVPQAQLSSF